MVKLTEIQGIDTWIINYLEKPLSASVLSDIVEEKDVEDSVSKNTSIQRNELIKGKGFFVKF